MPEQLKRAALSRAWTADPAIRDFVGLAENAWDFTAPDSMPGFGPMLPTDDIARMVAQITGKEESAGPAEGAESRATPGDSAHETRRKGDWRNKRVGPTPTRTDRENDQPSPLVADSHVRSRPAGREQKPLIYQRKMSHYRSPERPDAAMAARFRVSHKCYSLVPMNSLTSGIAAAYCC